MLDRNILEKGALLSITHIPEKKLRSQKVGPNEPVGTLENTMPHHTPVKQRKPPRTPATSTPCSAYTSYKPANAKCKLPVLIPSPLARKIPPSPIPNLTPQNTQTSLSQSSHTHPVNHVSNNSPLQSCSTKHKKNHRRADFIGQEKLPLRRQRQPIKNLPGKSKIPVPKKTPVKTRCEVCKVLWESKKDLELNTIWGIQNEWIGCDFEKCDYWSHARCAKKVVTSLDEDAIKKISFLCPQHQD